MRSRKAIGVFVVILFAVVPAENSAAARQEPSVAPLRFTLVLPSDIPSEKVQIQYFFSGANGGYGSSLQRQPELNQYELSVPAGNHVKVIAYMPGCELNVLELDADSTTVQPLDCRSLSAVRLVGRLVPIDILLGKRTEVEVRYEAFWDHEFFGIADGPVSSFRIASVAPDENGSFSVLLPDFAHDDVANRWKEKGEWSFLVREVGTENILAFLRPGDSPAGLRVQSSYPAVVSFRVVPN